MSTNIVILSLLILNLRFKVLDFSASMCLFNIQIIPGIFLAMHDTMHL